MEQLHSYNFKKLLFVVFILSMIPLISLSAKTQGDTDKKVAEAVIKKLEQRHKVFITYDAELLGKINISTQIEVLKKKSIEEALTLFLNGSDIRYKKMRNDFYVLVKDKQAKKKQIQNNPDSVHIFKGVVLDNNDMPLPGVAVWVRNTSVGTTTDLDGNFVISFSKESIVLTISYIGFKTINVDAAANSAITVKLEEDVFGLDEVIVSGVADGTIAKKLTVTVAKVTADQLSDAPAVSAASALQGKVAGVQITNAFGTPGGGATIRLRGSTSITGNQSPLILVDGIILESSLADINVDDIESYEVVKGAAAASLYGSRAGSGVIVITTKRGKNLQDGDFEITIRNEYGSSSLQKQLDLAEHHPYELASDADQFTTFTKYEGVRYDDEGNVNRGARKLNDTHYADQPYAYINDNQASFFSPGSFYTNYVSVANRSNRTNIFISFENNKQEGIVFSTDGYKRRNFRLNVDYNLTDKIKISTSNLIIDTESDNPGSNTAFFDLLFISPDVNLEALNEDGSLYKIKPDPWSIEENPLYPMYYRERLATRNSVLNSLILSYRPTDWLSFKAKYTFERLNKNWTTYAPRGYLFGGGQNIDGSVYKEQYTSTLQTYQYTMNMNKTYGDLTLKSKVSYLFEDKQYEDFWVTGREFITRDIPQLNNTNPEKASLSSYEGIIRAENVFGIVDFDYKDRYLLSALYRMDGSSLFGEDERWHSYYRVSAAYRITEDFSIPRVNELKIRAAYGTAGQRPGFSNQYEAWDIVSGVLQKSTLGNKNLKPSESEELEFALDAELFSRVTLTTSYSVTNTKDAFQLAPLPSHLGYPEQWQNVGTLNSDAFELAVGYVAIKKKNTSLQFNLTFDRIRQKITKLNIPEYKTGPKNAFLIKEGETLGTLYGYKWLTSLAEMEKQLPVDKTIDDYVVNSDGYVVVKGTEGTVDEKAVLFDNTGEGVADPVKIGDGNPDFRMGLNATFRWKDFSFYTLWDWKKGGDVYNYTHQYTFRDNRAIEFDQFGKAEDQKKTIDYYANFYHHTAINSYFIEDGSFVKLREVSIHYTLQKQNLGVLGKHVSSIRFGFVGRNLFTFTNYTGYDPEVASGSDLSNFPFDDFGYPNYKTLTGSVVIKF